MQSSHLATTPDGARHVALNGHLFTATVRTLAWRTLMRSKGQTMNSGRMLVQSMAVIDGGRSA
ncbi:hypothetical protein [Celeribacter ethanolicus]|uniref:hypothetical protein n=1 Tax=Celeribacter ethanolicus TaxID=1758178 RepID=UPI000829F8B1|nr:hypothetical protein [Celeribacter ethanolicus]